MGDHVVVVPPPMKDGDISLDFLNFSQAITSQANAITSQVQALTNQVTREVGPCMPLYTSNMDSRLRDFTLMNPLMFFWLNMDEDPQDFLDEVYKILFYMGVTTIEKAKLASYQLKDVVQTFYTQWRII